MLTIERVRSEVQTAPTTAKVGIVGLAFAGLADVIAHLEASEHVGHLHQHTSAEATAHLAAFVSMVVIYLGVVLDGARRTRAGRVASVRDNEGVA
jgi:hypothetical protein